MANNSPEATKDTGETNTGKVNHVRRPVLRDVNGNTIDEIELTGIVNRYWTGRKEMANNSPEATKNTGETNTGKMKHQRRLILKDVNGHMIDEIDLTGLVNRNNQTKMIVEVEAICSLGKPHAEQSIALYPWID